MEEDKLALYKERTEEVQDIIDRMPTKFGIYITMILFLLFLLILAFGWFIRYPDVISGQIEVNANLSPLKLVANSSGRLKLNSVESMEVIKRGQLIAYIENSADPSMVLFVDSVLKKYNPNDEKITQIQKKLPVTISLGELDGKYYTFSNVLREFTNYKQNKAYDTQIENQYQLLTEQKKAIATANKRIEMARGNLTYTHKFYSRDSILFQKKVISESELDRTQMAYLSSKDGLQIAVNNLINSKQAEKQTQGRIQDLNIQKPEKETQLKTALISAYNDLVDNIKIWEQKYLFKAPFSGKVQFLKFYTENHFITTGEQVFTIVPKQDRAFGQVFLPAQGTGKIREGQEVIVKLDDYPYMEYGSISGKVGSVSLTTSLVRNDKSDIEAYLITVDFPNQLVTNYGAKLRFKAATKGTAEIITNDRRLIQRLFDNLKYVVNK